MVNNFVDKIIKHTAKQNQKFPVTCIYIYIKKLFNFILNKEKLFLNILKLVNPVKHIETSQIKFIIVYICIYIFFHENLA